MESERRFGDFAFMLLALPFKAAALLLISAAGFVVMPFLLVVLMAVSDSLGEFCDLLSLIGDNYFRIVKSLLPRTFAVKAVKKED